MGKPKAIDFDPEALFDPASSSSEDDRSDDSISDADDDNAGREHYTVVEKSKLRKKAHVPLGPAYAGRVVSRQEIEDSDSDNPFAKKYYGNESDGEEDESEGDLEKGVNGVQLVDDEDQSDDDSDMDPSDEVDQSDSPVDENSGMDTDSDGSEASSTEASGKGATSGASAIRDMMKETASSATTLAANSHSDAAKGHAVKEQRKAFDSLLNVRIRLQKALISTNSMAAEQYREETGPDAAVEAAETAALTLLNNLTDLRLSLEEARTGKKRKRSTFDPNTPPSEIWANMENLERSTLPHRKTILERWSKKTKPTTVTNNKARLNASAEQTLTEVLDAQLTSTHLITRTQTPRSCAPIQSSNKAAQPDPDIFDDADFYSLLLKELLEQRSAELASEGSAEFIVQAPWQLAREAKTKKVVDTKASKGRKMRFTVQEKLQNFMAPEDRGTFTEQQRDHLFDRLFGRTIELGEQSEDDNGMDEDELVEDGKWWFTSHE